jgi:ATP-binding protein involved in chromosome partitioning
MQPPHGTPPKMALPGVKSLIAVASGKGGVGKSTIAANLALALKMHGRAVGLMDADIYGPSVPTMMGLGLVDQNTTPFPVEKYGLMLMSMGFLVDPNQAIIWRGPKVAQAVGAFLGQINWGPLDYLVIDLPPGTGDAQLTLTQSAPLTGAVIVTTPQDISLIDARKGLRMFNEVKVPVIGVVENMSYFVGEDGKRYDIFRSGGGRKLAQEAGVPLLGEIPIDPRIAECGDAGEPIVSKYPDSPAAAAFLKLAQVVMAEAQKAGATAGLPEVQL